MRVKKKHQGLHPYRYKDNPMENRFAAKWQEENDRTIGNGLLEYLLGDGSKAARDVTDRDRLVAATVVQWLGSQVGQHFLKKVLRKEMPCSSTSA